MPCALLSALLWIADTLCGERPTVRLSIAAPPGRLSQGRGRGLLHPGHGPLWRLILIALVCAPLNTVAQVPGIGGFRPGASIGAPEPPRPRISVPYDGAIAAYRAGRIDEALDLTEAALKAEPGHPELRFLRGVILTQRGRSDEALDVFQALVEEFPELPEPYNNIAFIQAGRGRWDEARRTLEQSVNAVPSYALAHENLGDIHLQLAAQAYSRAGRLDPQSQSVRRKLATSLELIDRTQAVRPDTPKPPNPRSGAPSQVKQQ